MSEKYLKKLVDCMQKTDMDAVMICPGEEMEFLLGFRPMLCERFQGFFVKKDGGMFYICNLLYQKELEEHFGGSVPVYSWFDGDVMTDEVAKAFAAEHLQGAKIGVNSDAQAFNILELMDKVDVTFCNAKPLLEEMRIIKDHEELNALRDSAAIADKVFNEVLEKIRPGATEKEIQDFLVNRMAELGGNNPGCIVAVDANASYPHYTGSKGIIGKQAVVLMDFGCTFRGLYSDMSRTVFVGEPTEKQRECYDLVKRSNEAAEAMVGEGAWIPDIDKKAREVLDERGYARSLINRLGHGVGYTIHEAPDIKQSNPRKLMRGMAFSIEPGIYLSGELGIRIEDVVIVNGNGDCEVLNKAPKELIML